MEELMKTTPAEVIEHKVYLEKLFVTIKKSIQLK